MRAHSPLPAAEPGKFRCNRLAPLCSEYHQWCRNETAASWHFGRRLRPGGTFFWFHAFLRTVPPSCLLPEGYLQRDGRGFSGFVR